MTDCSRVLRLPGFRNCKYGEPHYVRDVHETPAEQVWRPEDFPDYRTAPQKIEGPARKPHYEGDGQHSQSERDWSYAMRALERGESPSVIQARIEAYRQDKPNPHYYAARTVSRALAHRARSASHPARESSNPLDIPGLDR